tara:strand:+ start:63 stop:815 length:753 start_codon:yes stop_codon:yes gene_type:complete
LVKFADEGQPLSEEPGVLQGSYVARSQGLDSITRANKKQLQYPETKSDTFDKLLNITNRHLEKNVLPADRRYNANHAESQTHRILSQFSPKEVRVVNTLIAAFKDGGKRESTAKKRFTKHYADELPEVDTSAEVSKNQTPWHLGQQGDFAAGDAALAYMEGERKSSPGHYYLNPFMRAGPVEAFLTRLRQRARAGASDPETAGGRATATLTPFYGLLRGDEKAQQKLRSAAYKNKFYGDDAQPRKKKKSK